MHSIRSEDDIELVTVSKIKINKNFKIKMNLKY